MGAHRETRGWTQSADSPRAGWRRVCDAISRSVIVIGGHPPRVNQSFWHGSCTLHLIPGRHIDTNLTTQGGGRLLFACCGHFRLLRFTVFHLSRSRFNVCARDRELEVERSRHADSEHRRERQLGAGTVCWLAGPEAEPARSGGGRAGAVTLSPCALPLAGCVGELTEGLWR